MKRLIIALWLSIVLSVMVVIPAFTAYGQSVVAKTPLTKGPVQQINKHFSTQTTTYNDGTTLIRNIINGPSKPPSGYELERSTAKLPTPNKAMATNTLTVPAFNWVFGCSSVSGAMIAGYYDRNGFPNIYTGPTNGGVMPLDNSSWGTWSDGDDTYPNLPLAASHNGVDGRTTRGSIDDYWIKYGSSDDDPYITGSWTQHTWSDAIGDYMKTSQSAYGNTDGATTFWSLNSTKLTCSAMESYGISDTDGTYGRKLFYEARGYTVTDCYNQLTDNKYSGGFSFSQFKAEIDAGRPVMLNLEGHTVVGVGYNDSTNTVYIHDTWDYSNHTMTWGGSYSGMALWSVSIVNLLTTTTTQPNLTPYQPPGWSDKIVVSNTTGTNTDTSPIYTTDALYVDWAVINNGTGATSATFITTLYVDGVPQPTWYSLPPLNINNYSSVSDYSIGTLSAGNHTIKIVTDTTGVISESNESDNEYTRTISVIQPVITQPNLTPYQPPGWSDKIVVSNTTGTTTDTTPIYTTDTLYVDWSVINDGTGATSATFSTTLYVDGVAQQTWHTNPPLGINNYTDGLYYSIGTLSAGDHTIKIVTDTTGAISESNESDNEYTRTISVVNESCSNLPVRGTGGSYSTLQYAYDVALDGDTIQSQAVVVGSDLNFNQNISVTIKGGYDCDYSTNDQQSIVNGPITVRNGTVTIENVIIK